MRRVIFCQSNCHLTRPSQISSNENKTSALLLRHSCRRIVRLRDRRLESIDSPPLPVLLPRLISHCFFAPLQYHTRSLLNMPYNLRTKKPRERIIKLIKTKQNLIASAKGRVRFLINYSFYMHFFISTTPRIDPILS